MNIIKRRRIFLTISGILIILSIVSLIVYGLKLSIDFTGGSRLEIAEQENQITRGEIEEVYSSEEINVNSIQETENGYRISSSTMDDEKKERIVEELEVSELSYELLGPTIGSETRDKAILAIIVALFAITIYIAIAFWRSGGVISSWKFGVTAIIALFHDVIITLGAFSVFGVLFNVEIDALFITAILTIMGFSVHDTIVVFDRIRENITNNIKKLPFEELVNNSITDTISRSLNTSVTVIFVLFAMALFGGETIFWFVIAFIIGVMIGTYSSIFIAAPVLLEWHHFDNKGGFAKLKKDIKNKIRKK